MSAAASPQLTLRNDIESHDGPPLLMINHVESHVPLGVCTDTCSLYDNRTHVFDVRMHPPPRHAQSTG